MKGHLDNRKVVLSSTGVWQSAKRAEWNSLGQRPRGKFLKSHLKR